MEDFKSIDPHKVYITEQFHKNIKSENIKKLFKKTCFTFILLYSFKKCISLLVLAPMLYISNRGWLKQLQLIWNLLSGKPIISALGLL